MDSFEFYNPVKIIFGIGKIKQAGSEAAQIADSALLVSYKDHDYCLPLLNDLTQQLHEAGVKVVTHFSITANPLLSQVQNGVDLCKANQLSMVIGVGGGSVMDASKCIAAGVLYSHDLWKMFMSRHDNAVTIVSPKNALPLMMIPTLPATSSEMNCGAVVTNDATVEKSYVFHECLYPMVSLIDPELTCGLPPYQTACGAVDAISHVIESYFNSSDDTPLQDRLQESVIITIMELATKVLRDPSNVNLRANIQWASVLAWNGWIQAGITPGSPMHQLGHVISARFNVTHGATLGMIMPAWMRYVYKDRLNRYVQFAERVFGIPSLNRPPQDVALEGINRFEDFIRQVGVPIRMSEVGVKENDLNDMTDEVARISFSENNTLFSRPPIGRLGVREVFSIAL